MTTRIEYPGGSFELPGNMPTGEREGPDVSKWKQPGKEMSCGCVEGNAYLLTCDTHTGPLELSEAETVQALQAAARILDGER